jgi:hypothetical protein
MTSKPKAVEAAPAVEAVAPETPVVQKKPFAIKVGAIAHQAMNQMVVLARQGYCVSEAPVELMPNGFMFFTAILGDPDQLVIQGAAEAMEFGRAEEERDYKKAVQDAAKAMLEAQRQEELAKRVAEIKAQQAKLIKAAEQEAQAAIAALQ